MASTTAAAGARAGQSLWSSRSPQRPPPAIAAAPSSAAHRRRTTASASSYDQQQQQQQQQQQAEARGVLEAFYLGRAVASAAARRASEAALQLLAEVGAAAAEQPARLEALRQEILDEARAEVGREMGPAAGGGGGGSGALVPSSSSSSRGAAGARAGGFDATAGESAEAVADELRADVAECRMMIRELRESSTLVAESR